MKKFCQNLLGHYWILLISCILFAISITLNVSSCTISNTSLVLTFIGILASIVIIGNFSQVLEIKHEFNQKAEELKKEQLELKKEIENLNEVVKDLKNNNNDIVNELIQLKNKEREEKNDK